MKLFSKAGEGRLKRCRRKYKQEVTVLTHYSVTTIQITSQHPGLDLDEKGSSEIPPPKEFQGPRSSPGLFRAVNSKCGLGLVSACKLLSLCEKISTEMKMFRNFYSSLTE